jgi:hypothetical protein
MPPAQRGVAMHPQRGRCLAKRLGRHQCPAETEPFVLLAQSGQGGSRQGVEGALTCLAAVALQPVDLSMQVKSSALTVRAAARLGRVLRLNHREPLLLVIEFIKPFSEQRPLAQREARNLFYQPIESLGVHGYLQAGSLFTLLLWVENSTSNGDRAYTIATALLASLTLSPSFAYSRCNRAITRSPARRLPT